MALYRLIPSPVHYHFIMHVFYNEIFNDIVQDAKEEFFRKKTDELQPKEDLMKICSDI